MTVVPLTRVQRRRRRTWWFLVSCFVGVSMGWPAHHLLYRVTRAPQPWFAEFPEDGDEVESWQTIDTQRLWEAKPDEAWQHYRRWFVVSRAPRANGRQLGPEEWYFIDPVAKRMVGPWQPGVTLPRHGFMPDGRYVGLRTNPTQGTFRMLMFNPETGQSEVREFDGRSGGATKVWRRICLSADCSTLAVVEVRKVQEFWVRFFDVASGRTIAERTLRYTGYPSGSYFRRSPRRDEGPPILYALSPDGSYFIIADTSEFQVINTQEGRTVATGQAWDPDDPQWASPPVMFGVEFTPDGQSVVLAFCRFRYPTTEVRRTFSLQQNDFVGEPRSRRGYITYSRTGGPHSRFLLSGKNGVRLQQRCDYLLDNRQNVAVTAPVTFPPQATLRFAVGGEPSRALRMKYGYDAVGIGGIPDSDLIVVNTLHRTDPSKARVPFLRPVLDYLKLDQPKPTRLLEGIWHYHRETGKWELIRQLIRKNPRSRTQVSVQPGRVGLMMKKDGRYRFEVWPLPRYRVTWVRQAATSIGVCAFFSALVCLSWRSSRRSPVITSE